MAASDENVSPPANLYMLEVLLKAIPYPAQLSDIDWTQSRETLYFKWRSARYRVSANMHVEEVGHGVLIGSDNAILMQRLLQIVNFARQCGDSVLPAV